MNDSSGTARLRTGINRFTGFDVVRFSGHHTLRSHLHSLLSQYRIDCVVDVGANEGGYGRFLRDLGYAGRICSFEPVASAFGKLSSLAAADPAWSVFDFALGSANATASINVSRFTQMSSFLPATDYGRTNWENLEVESTQQVEVRTLAQCFEQGLVPHGGNVLLKMDTQGYDLEVFKGALPVLDRIACMQSEMSLIPLYQGMPDFSQALDAYRAEGFVVAGFFPITRNAALALNEVDCTFVRQSVPTDPSGP